MENIALIAAIIIIVGLATFYVYKAKKSGKKCIGCPEGCHCGQDHKQSCSCGCEEDK